MAGRVRASTSSTSLSSAQQSPDSGGGGDYLSASSKTTKPLKISGKVINSVGMKRTANFYAEFRDETSRFNKKEDTMLQRQLRVLQRQERVANHALRKTRQEAERLRKCVRDSSDRTLDLTEYDELKKHQRFANMYASTSPLGPLTTKKGSALKVPTGPATISSTLQPLLRRRPAPFSQGATPEGEVGDWLKVTGNKGMGDAASPIKLPAIDLATQPRRPIYDSQQKAPLPKKNNTSNNATVTCKNNNNVTPAPRPLAKPAPPRDHNNNNNGMGRSNRLQLRPLRDISAIVGMHCSNGHRRE